MRVVEEEGVERGVRILWFRGSARESILFWRRLGFGGIEMGEDDVEVFDGDGFGV